MTEYRTETVFTWGAPPLKFGVGALDEIGFDCAQLGLERVLIVTDEGVAATGIPGRAAESMQQRRASSRPSSPARTSSRRTRASARRPHSRATPTGTGSLPSAAGRRSTPPRRSTC